MVKRGKIVKQRLADLGVKIKSLAPKLKKNEHYIYQMLDRDDLSWDVIRKIGEEIRYDFRNDFPDMPFQSEYMESDLESGSLEEQPLTLQQEVKKWKDKYFQLLEDVSQHMREKKNEYSVETTNV
jgi:hypothetical protein